MKFFRTVLHLTLLFALTMLAGCAGSGEEQLEVPTNLPPICRDIDFSANPDMREVCGVRKAHNKAYKNIPQQRYLIKPAETSIVRTGNKLELRFQNSLPITLTGGIVDDLHFSQDLRLERVKNTYDYYEIFNKESGSRMRIFKMGIPTEARTTYSFCFLIPEKKGFFYISVTVKTVTTENRYIHNALKQVRLHAACSSMQGFSISGLATYLQFPEMNFCVDMGECPLSATPIDHVFLTHAHGDHARCIMRHNSLRKMMGVERDSVYYIPESIYEGAKAWIKAEAMFEGVNESKFRYPELEPVKAGTRTPLRYRKDLVIEPFEVRHSVPAMGATVYLHKKKLLDEFLGKSAQEIIELRQKGVEITREVYDPQLGRLHGRIPARPS